MNVPFAVVVFVKDGVHLCTGTGGVRIDDFDDPTGVPEIMMNFSCVRIHPNPDRTAQLQRRLNREERKHRMTLGRRQRHRLHREHAHIFPRPCQSPSTISFSSKSSKCSAWWFRGRIRFARTAGSKSPSSYRMAYILPIVDCFASSCGETTSVICPG